MSQAGPSKRRHRRPRALPQDDIAAALERAAALASWADPFATALALLACVAAAMLVAALGLSPVLAWGMCWLVRAPAGMLACTHPFALGWYRAVGCVGALPSLCPCV
jgi:hypothetical protein